MHKKIHTKYFFNTHLHHAQIKEEEEEDRPQWGRRPRRRKHSEKKLGNYEPCNSIGENVLFFTSCLCLFSVCPPSSLLRRRTDRGGGKGLSKIFLTPPRSLFFFSFPPLPVGKGGLQVAHVRRNPPFFQSPPVGEEEGKGREVRDRYCRDGRNCTV